VRVLTVHSSTERHISVMFLFTDLHNSGRRCGLSYVSVTYCLQQNTTSGQIPSAVRSWGIMRHRLRAFAVASVDLLYQHVTTVSILQNWWVLVSVLICFFNTVLCASSICIVHTTSVWCFICSTHCLVKSTECPNNVICCIFLLLPPAYVQTAKSQHAISHLF